MLKRPVIHSNAANLSCKTTKKKSLEEYDHDNGYQVMQFGGDDKGNKSVDEYAIKH